MSEYLVYSKNMTKAKAEIKAFGGAVLHVFGKQAMVVNLPGSVTLNALMYSSIEKPARIDAAVLSLINAWRDAQVNRSRRSAEDTDGIPWDTKGFLGP